MTNSNLKKTRLIVIVGGTGGIGSEMTKLFLQKGDKVCVTSYELVSQENSNNCFSYQMDLSDDNSVNRVFQKINKDHGCLFTFIYNLPADYRF